MSLQTSMDGPCNSFIDLIFNVALQYVPLPSKSLMSSWVFLSVKSWVFLSGKGIVYSYSHVYFLLNIFCSPIFCFSVQSINDMVEIVSDNTTCFLNEKINLLHCLAGSLQALKLIVHNFTFHLSFPAVTPYFFFLSFLKFLDLNNLVCSLYLHLMC